MNKSFLKYAALFAVFVAFSIGINIKLNRIENQLHEMTRSGKRFSPAHVLCQFNYRQDWDVEVSPELVTYVNVITQQPFHWLAKGFQAYAFESQDGEYVLKFFQQQRLQEKTFKTNPFSFLFSKSFREKADFVKNHREEIFSSSKLAFEEIPRESGILFVHLNKTENLLRGIRISDPMGQGHKIKGDEASFLIQRKATYIRPTFKELMVKGDVEGAKRRLDQIFDLLLTLAKKSIVDGDIALIRNNNIGFTKDRAIYIDTGHLVKKTDVDVKKQMDYEFKKRLKPLYDWLNIEYPVLADYYELRRHEIITALKEPKESAANIATVPTETQSLQTAHAAP